MSRSAVPAALASETGLVSRRRHPGWGPTNEDVLVALPVDQIVTDPDITATRAATLGTRRP